MAFTVLISLIGFIFLGIFVYLINLNTGTSIKKFQTEMLKMIELQALEKIRNGAISKDIICDYLSNNRSELHKIVRMYSDFIKSKYGEMLSKDQYFTQLDIWLMIIWPPIALGAMTGECLQSTFKNHMKTIDEMSNYSQEDLDKLDRHFGIA